MKTLLKTLFGVLTLSFAPIASACDIPSDEALVCEVVLCNPLGLAISESRSKCMQVNRRFAIYLAKLGFWDKPPKCKMRDKNCKKTGEKIVKKDISFCDYAPPEQKEACLRAVIGDKPPVHGCERYRNNPERYEQCLCEKNSKGERRICNLR